MASQKKTATAMESIKMTQAMAYKIKDVSPDDKVFTQWNYRNCKMDLEDNKNLKMLRLDLHGNVEERRELRQEIFDAIRNAEPKLSEEDRDRLLVMEVQIPDNRCGFVIGTEGETIKRLKAETGVRRLYISSCKTGWINRNPQPNFSWLIIVANQVVQLADAWQKVEDLLEVAARIDPQGLGAGKVAKNGIASSCSDEENGAMRVRMNIPAAEFFSEEQQALFNEIKRSYRGVTFEMDSSDPGEQQRFITLSGTHAQILSAKRKLNELIAEVKTSSDEHPIPPAPRDLDLNVNNQPQHTVKNLVGAAPIDPVQPKKLETTELLVPAQCIALVIGNRGEVIKRLKEKFGVRLQFQGDNYLDYPNGRKLKIAGDSAEKVQKVKDYIDQEFILRRWDALNTYQHDIEKAPCEEIFLMSPQLSKREDLEAHMKEMMKRSGLASYAYRGPRDDGYRPVILKGSEQAVREANRLLAEMEKKWACRPALVRSQSDASLTPFPSNDTLDMRDECKVSGKPKLTTFGNMAKTTMLNRSDGRGVITTANLMNSNIEKAKAKKQQQTRNNQKKEMKWSSDEEEWTSNGEEKSDANISELENLRQQLSMSSKTQSDCYNTNQTNEASSNKSTATCATSVQRELSVNPVSTSSINCSVLREMIDKMEKEMKAREAALESSQAELERVQARLKNLLCVKCGIIERTVLFTPCCHLLYCKDCATPLHKCPICKIASGKKTLFLGSF